MRIVDPSGNQAWAKTLQSSLGPGFVLHQLGAT